MPSVDRRLIPHKEAQKEVELEEAVGLEAPVELAGQPVLGVLVSPEGLGELAGLFFEVGLMRPRPIAPIH